MLALISLRIKYMINNRINNVLLIIIMVIILPLSILSHLKANSTDNVFFFFLTYSHLTLTQFILNKCSDLINWYSSKIFKFNDLKL